MFMFTLKNLAHKGLIVLFIPRMSRVVSNSVLSQWQDEGEGARIMRSVGRAEVRQWGNVTRQLVMY